MAGAAQELKGLNEVAKQRGTIKLVFGRLVDTETPGATHSISKCCGVGSTLLWLSVTCKYYILDENSRYCTRLAPRLETGWSHDPSVMKASSSWHGVCLDFNKASHPTGAIYQTM